MAFDSTKAAALVEHLNKEHQAEVQKAKVEESPKVQESPVKQTPPVVEQASVGSQQSVNLSRQPQSLNKPVNNGGGNLNLLLNQTAPTNLYGPTHQSMRQQEFWGQNDSNLLEQIRSEDFKHRQTTAFYDNHTEAEKRMVS